MSAIIETLSFLAEQISAKQAVALQRFAQHKHKATMLVSSMLVAAWSKRLPKLPDVKPQLKDQLLAVNPKASVSIELIEQAIRLQHQSEYNRGLEVSPAVKVPLALSPPERLYVLNVLLDTAQEVLERLVVKLPAVFSTSRSDGTFKPDFKVRRDSKSVRLSLITKVGNVEHETAVFYVAVEHGKLNSKARSFDLVYLGVPV
jgi:hypothetical protein